MLKITMSKTGTEDRWTLHGQLTAPWVSELRTVWQNTQGADKQRRCVFDLNEVTLVDKAGEKLLHVFAKQGVQFEATGIYVRGVPPPQASRRVERRSGNNRAKFC